MRQMPEICSYDSPARRATTFGLIAMAIHEMGNGYCRPPANGTRQFIGSKVTQFLEDHKIQRILPTPYHPCANGQAESKNKTIIQNLKKKPESAKGKRRETLPKVLWAYRITSKSSTGKTPFSLVYGAEALIPVEIGEPSTRFQHTTESSNNEAMTRPLNYWMRNEKPR
ncbi:PREDICTED: uncharacterized protein LOC109231465 [Nicotiana attenuata]|uniref:uncharacterized protein LOC109231465 n=1 Tax=Nicotiana attenuata TaxID=49451 RepID=UPI000904A35B|nr:PREDICTED: uncharacterized protein LOC109231465 [Nicotiana attenuata]